MNQVSAGGFTRVTKKKARSLFSEGKDVYMLPCKLNPANIWMAPALMVRPDVSSGDNVPNNANLFDRIENEYSYYNCGSYEMGYYTSFYIKDEDAA